MTHQIYDPTLRLTKFYFEKTMGATIKLTALSNGGKLVADSTTSTGWDSN